METPESKALAEAKNPKVDDPFTLGGSVKLVGFICKTCNQEIDMERDSCSCDHQNKPSPSDLSPEEQRLADKFANDEAPAEGSKDLYEAIQRLATMVGYSLQAGWHMEDWEIPVVVDMARESIATKCGPLTTAAENLNTCRETLMACTRITDLWLPANAGDDDDEAYALVLMHQRILKTIEDTKP